MDLRSAQSRTWFGRFAWGVLAYNLPVILWGAYVRVSFSGDGCGAHWPSCNGQLLPTQMAAPTMIEFTHRMMTSLDSIAVIALCVWAFLAFPKRHALRRYTLLSLAFLLVEALLGAGLVLFRYVAKDQSAGRAWYLSAHLTNTMLLLAVLTAVAWLAQTNTQRLRFGDPSRNALAALAVTVVVSITGAIAALGDTLFPASSLTAGMQQDFSSASSWLLRLRLLHPVIAVLGAVYLLWIAITLRRGRDESDPTRVAAGRVITLVVFQVAAGAINISLLAPVWMQLIHLLIADVVWIAVVMLALETVRPQHIGSSAVVYGTFAKAP
ncbi:MAG TPA: COX15/CtaA family protein [Bryobacteraceae bacterium]